MRHILAPGTVAARPRGMGEPSAVAGLVAPPRVAQATLAGTRGAVTGAIDLATIATATDQRLDPAFRAHEHPRGCHVALVGPASMMWTNATIDRIMASHACPGTVWGTASSVTAKFGSAPCLPPRQASLYPATSRRVSPRSSSRSSAEPTIHRSRTLTGAAGAKPPSAHRCAGFTRVQTAIDTGPSWRR